MAGLITVQQNNGLKCSSCDQPLRQGEGIIESADKTRVFHYPVCPWKKYDLGFRYDVMYDIRDLDDKKYNVDENWE